jgi:hypothetical protein
MSEKIISDKAKHIGKKLFDYSQELVMLNYAFESKLLTKEEMVVVKQDIVKSYGVQEVSFLK